MSSLLVTTLSVGPIGAGIIISLPHGLYSNSRRLIPKIILPNRATPIIVLAADTHSIAFQNNGLATEAAVFYVQFNHTIQQAFADNANVLYWQGIASSGGGGGPASDLEGIYDCLSDLAVGAVCYLSSANTAAAADADDHTKQPVIGFCKAKPTPTTATIQYYGEVPGLFSGLTTGATYFLSIIPGQMSTGVPSGTGDIVQRVGFAKSATTFVVMVDRDFTIL